MSLIELSPLRGCLLFKWFIESGLFDIELYVVLVEVCSAFVVFIFCLLFNFLLGYCCLLLILCSQSLLLLLCQFACQLSVLFLSVSLHVFVYDCMCTCMCVWEREREREWSIFLITHIVCFSMLFIWIETNKIFISYYFVFWILILCYLMSFINVIFYIFNTLVTIYKNYVVWYEKDLLFC